MSVFNLKPVDHMKQPMFFGEDLNVARYETNKYPQFDRFTDLLHSFFWRPVDIRMSQDKVDFASFERHEEHIYTENLGYQTLLDSVQGRAVAEILGPILTLPELNTFAHTWNFSETIHSRSYTHMIRALYGNPSAVFDKIMRNPAILARAVQVNRYYDELAAFNTLRAARSLQSDPFNKGILSRLVHALSSSLEEFFGRNNSVRRQTNEVEFDYEHKKAVIRCLYSINVLEAIRFYGSFACTFLFAKNGKMEGSAKIMRYIARDEAVHHSASLVMLQILEDGREGAEWARASADVRAEDAVNIVMEAVDQEVEWGEHLFQYGSMMGLNAAMYRDYIYFRARKTLGQLRILPPDSLPVVAKDPLPWMEEYLTSGKTQGAPQEAEKSDYLVGAVNTEYDRSKLKTMDF